MLLLLQRQPYDWPVSKWRGVSSLRSAWASGSLLWAQVRIREIWWLHTWDNWMPQCRFTRTWDVTGKTEAIIIELMTPWSLPPVCAGSKWKESGFRPPLCTYRLNWARRASWGWWDDWDDTALQTQDSKFEPWRSEAEHATSRSQRLPTILTFTRGWGRNIFCFFQTVETGNRTPNSGVKGSGANHYPRAPAQCQQ